MAKVKVLWGRIMVFFLAVGGGASYLTYPMWEPTLRGTALEAIPQRASQWASSVDLGGIGSTFRGAWQKLSSWLPFWKGEAAQVANLLPGDTIAVLMVQRADKLAEEITPFLKGLEEGAGGEQVGRTQLQQRSQQKFGADLTDPATLAALDLDLTRGWALTLLALPSAGSSASEKRGAFALLVPVKDESTALEGFQTLLQKNQQVATRQSSNVGDWYQVNPELSYAAYKDQLLIVVGTERKPSAPPVTAQDVLSAFQGASDHLADQKTFQKHSKAYGNDWQLFGYVNLNDQVFPELSSLDEREKQALLAVKGAAVSGVLKADNHQVRLVGSMSVPEGYEDGLVSVKGTDPVSSHLSGLPIAVLRSGIDLPQVMATMATNPESKRELEEWRVQVQQNLGLRLDEDIARNLDGQLGAVVLKSEAQGAPNGLQGLLASLAGSARQADGVDWPMGVVGWMGVRDADVLRPALVAQVKQLQAEGKQVTLESAADGTWASVYDNGGELFGVGLTKDVLVVSAGPGFPTRVRASLGEGDGPGFVTSLPKTAQEGLREDQQGYFYLDLPRALEAVQGNVLAQATLMSPQGQLVKALVDNSVQGISSRSWEEAGLGMGELAIHGPDDGFVAHADELGALLQKFDAR